MGAARRQRPEGPLATPVFNIVEYGCTTKIKFIFVGLAAAAAKAKERSRIGPFLNFFLKATSVLSEPVITL